MRNLVSAMLLGDGSLERGKTGARYSMSHCLKQGPYLQAKADLLGEGYRVQSKCWGKIRALYMKTTMKPEWAEVYDEFYPGGKKSFGVDQVSQLDALGWAIWYADDGNLDCGKRAAIWASRKVLQEPERVRDYMEAKFGTVTLHEYRIKNSQMYHFYLTDNAVKVFWPYVASSLRGLEMGCKLPEGLR